MQKINVKQLAELAQTVEVSDPIEWGMMTIREQDAYQMMASHVIEMLNEVPESSRELVMMSTLTKLLVENFVINLKLHTDKHVTPKS
jgi:hypothetical protein